MKVICLSQDGLRQISFSFSLWFHLLLPVLGLLILTVGLAIVWGLFQIKEPPLSALLDSNVGINLPYPLPMPVPPNNPLNSTLLNESNIKRANHSSVIVPIRLDNKKTIKEEELDILTRHLGVLEAELLRLNAFATRIANMAKLDPNEFSFSQQPAQGGVKKKNREPINNHSESLLQALNRLENKILNQRYQLESMLQSINGRLLVAQTMPDNMPIKKGYISSPYGLRRDPFTGVKRRHKGMDFAARKGEPIIAVGAGVVAFSGWDGGHGNSIKIDHGNDLITRFSHMSRLWVKKGQVVKKGQKIGEVGSTGRSTGPHLHFEVQYKGVHQNPKRYLKKKGL